jgi:hypothetical protein
MPEEIEVPTEHLHEAMEEKAEEGGFNLRVALTSALVAVLAAICALFAGGHANEALVAQIKCSDTWAFYQAKSIKSSMLSNKIEMMQAAGHKAKPEDLAKLDEYKKDMEEKSAEATKLGQEADELLERHEILAKGVTLFQIAIALSAISVLTRKKFLWVGGLLLSLGGIYFLFMGLR